MAASSRLIRASRRRKRMKYIIAPRTIIAPAAAPTPIPALAPVLSLDDAWLRGWLLLGEDGLVLVTTLVVAVCPASVVGTAPEGELADSAQVFADALLETMLKFP
jgi:hypothetical protein